MEKSIMARKRVDKSMLGALIQGATTQTTSRGFKPTYDEKFEMFRTPLEKAILVYIPKTNVIATEDGETMDYLRSVQHSVNHAKFSESHRCINELSGDGYEALGYTGTCPLCEANAKSWELFNKKVESWAKSKGIDIKKDNSDNKEYEEIRSKYGKELAVSSPDKFSTFPICIINNKHRYYEPADDAMDTIKTVFVQWKEKRVKEKLVAAISQMLNPVDHLGGTLWVWDFQYDTEGGKANPMTAAQKATYTCYEVDAIVAKLNSDKPGTGDNLLKVLEQCEINAQEYTVETAGEQIKASEFLYFEDVQEIADKAIVETQTLIDAYNGNTQQQEQQVLGGNQQGGAPLLTVPGTQQGQQVPSMGNMGQQDFGQNATNQQQGGAMASFGKVEEQPQQGQGWTQQNQPQQ